MLRSLIRREAGIVVRVRDAGRGFTVIEALITVAILAILLALAAPSFAKFIKDNRRASAVNDLIVSVQIARSEATRRGQRVVVCPSNDAQTACAVTEDDEPVDWSGGWIVHAITAGGPEVIRVFPATPQVMISSDRARFIYPPPTDRLGTSEPPNLALWTVMDDRGSEHARFVDVLPSGRPRTLCPQGAEFAPGTCA